MAFSKEGSRPRLMWDAVKQVLLSQSFWSAIIYLLLGAILGALISVHYSLRAQKPRLIISGGGGGGNQHRQTWQLNVSNRPSFLGQALDGDSARDVYPLIRLRDKKSQPYPVFWWPGGEHRVTIEAGEQKPIALFHWFEGSKGYCIIDGTGEPIARFEDRELEYVLILHDLLGRRTKFSFTVEFDDTHLKNAPRLQIIQPTTVRDRFQAVREGVQSILWAFRLR